MSPDGEKDRLRNNATFFRLVYSTRSINESTLATAKYELEDGEAQQPQKVTSCLRPQKQENERMVTKQDSEQLTSKPPTM